MKERAIAQDFYRQFDRQICQSGVSVAEALPTLHFLLHRCIEVATQPERLHFTTLYARIAFLGHKHQLSPELIYHLNAFRFRERAFDRTTPAGWQSIGSRILLELVESIYQQPVPTALRDIRQSPWPWPRPDHPPGTYFPALRVVALEEVPEQEQLLVRLEDRPEQTAYLYYGGPEANEQLAATAQILRRICGFPATLNLLDVRQTGEEIRARTVIIEPDYLIDVTAVAESFQGHATYPWSYLAKKLLPYRLSGPLLRGTVANFFLDELIHRPDTTFAELKRRIFSLHPLGFCLLPDGEIRKIMGELQAQFLTLKQTTLIELPDQEIVAEQCQLEPSFYAPMYGLQGRLDLLHRRTTDRPRTAIVELKSGSPFMANKYGLGASHYVQTILYDLLIRATYGAKSQVASYILYSGLAERPLRFAPPERSMQEEALQVRNQLLAIDYKLAQLGHPTDQLLGQTDRLFARLDPQNQQGLRGFLRNDFERMATAYQQLDATERCYLGAFLGFTAREHRLAKTGEQGNDRLNGLASLWLDDGADKDERFERLCRLTFDHTRSGNDYLITFNRPNQEGQLVKFRTGDIAVLYPMADPNDQRAILRNQIFKCTIVELTAEQVVLRLRSQQRSDRIFRAHPHWTVERDLLDSGFASYYRSLFAWAERPRPIRDLWLGRRHPHTAPPAAIDRPSGMTDEQFTILRQMLAAPDYFLLWGPPGTGKTSVMLHHYVRQLLENTEEQLLLLAYTNRAVDEICESIERIGGPEPFHGYLRIGSRYGTAAAFQDRLLQVQTESLTRRSEVRQLLAEHRILVGTVASLAGKPELFELKHFDRIVVDEASQILEPLLIGLLPNAPRALLIGDHYQLPAVVGQSSDWTIIDEPHLREIGLTDLSISLFERLFKYAQKNQLDGTYAMLTQQGRMHQEIMRFASDHFYRGRLDILPEGIPHRKKQLAPLPSTPHHLFTSRRFLFWNTAADPSGADLKTNRFEAQQLVVLVRYFEAFYQAQGATQALQPHDIGIITPYRAQIACIYQALREAGLPTEHYTVDTVERYQGGARKIILVSLCVNSPFQLHTLSSLSEDGVDRKLNVALTRAREHLVILGCGELLEAAPTYGKLIEFCRASNAYIPNNQSIEIFTTP